MNNDERLGRLETSVEQLTANQADLQRLLTKVVDRMDSGFARVNEQIHLVHEKFNSIGKTSWPLVVTIIATSIAMAGLILTIGRMAIAPIVAEIDEHKAMPGHFEAMRLHAAYAERFQAIAERINGVDGIVHENQRDIENIKATRFSSDDGHGLLDRVTRIETTIAHVMRTNAE